MKINFKKWISSILLIPIVVYLINNGGKFIFIDYINLLIHEGGHGIFKLFGKFIYTLGGTITQILIPLMFVVYYLKVNNTVIAQIFLIWLGENFLNISAYASDARLMRLPLLGGKKVYHDWNYILNETGIINYDHIVGDIFYYLGLITFLLALILPAIKRDYKQINLDMKL
ncbi:hypothetical protein [Rosettibacter firmus]|uniref:hypothetical protein n=1 Tax=Rosettibacter firmus TaxID=3111522 RepID=UPI00336BD6C5